MMVGVVVVVVGVDDVVVIVMADKLFVLNIIFPRPSNLYFIL